MKNLQRIMNSHKLYIDTAFVATGIILGAFLGWDWLLVGVFAASLWIILNPISYKKLSLATAVSMIISLSLMVLRREPRATEMAVVSFFFMVMTLLMFLFDEKSQVDN